MFVLYTYNMKKLGQDIEYYLATLTGDQDQMRINLRALQVRDRYKTVLKSVYRDSSSLFLQHTNNVYIVNKDGLKTLIVYVDESIFAAELNAQRELIKLKLLQLFGEEVEDFNIYISRGQYKNHHPYELDQSEKQTCAYQAVPLSESEQEYVKKTTETIESQPLKNSFEKAMTAAMELNKSELGKQ